MKKKLLGVSLILCLGLCACDKKPETTEVETNTEVATEQEDVFESNMDVTEESDDSNVVDSSDSYMPDWYVPSDEIKIGDLKETSSLTAGDKTVSFKPTSGMYSTDFSQDEVGQYESFMFDPYEGINTTDAVVRANFIVTDITSAKIIEEYASNGEKHSGEHYEIKSFDCNGYTYTYVAGVGTGSDGKIFGFMLAGVDIEGKVYTIEVINNSDILLKPEDYIDFFAISVN